MSFPHSFMVGERSQRLFRTVDDRKSHHIKCGIFTLYVEANCALYNEYFNVL